MVLQRGYSITTRAVDGAVLRRANHAQPGDVIDTRLGNGRIASRVEGVFPDADA
jgi:exonuclease VII large subunit